MKTQFLFLQFSLILAAFSCDKTSIEVKSKDCIATKIEEYKESNLPCESGKSIYKYSYQGSCVYVFNPGDCGADMTSEVYDKDCNHICSLGGIAGNAMCNEEAFYENATNETLLWEN